MKFVNTKESEYDRRLRYIHEHPENHVHRDLNDLHRCCMVPTEGSGQALDISLLQAHSDACAVGYNGGTACDVLDGPCSCGAWHRLEDDRNGLTPLGRKMRKKLLEDRK